jgi:hypothetical protein
MAAKKMTKAANKKANARKHAKAGVTAKTGVKAGGGTTGIHGGGPEGLIHALP